MAHMPIYQGVLNLNDPTSVRMQTSFLIKNQQAANFEQYIQMMKKRKAILMQQTHGSFKPTNETPRGNDGLSPGLGKGMKFSELSPKRHDVSGIVENKCPAARDGHSAVFYQDKMIIFGGDRHRMPYADTFQLDLKAQLNGKNLN